MKKSNTGFGAKALVIKGEEILVLIKPNEQFDLPGGRVEEGKSAEECLHRELYEELGPIHVKLLFPAAKWAFTKDSGVKIKGVTWVCSFIGGSIRLSIENSGFIWTDKSRLQALAGFGLWKYGLSNPVNFSLQKGGSKTLTPTELF